MCEFSFGLHVCAIGIDVDKARKEEERIMLQDAMAVQEGGGTLTPHPNTKATALHVAAAKGYIEVLKWAFLSYTRAAAFNSVPHSFPNCMFPSLSPFTSGCFYNVG